MNLQDLRSKVKNITDYSPDLKSYQDQVDDLINDAYYTIWTSKRWKFSQVKEAMKVYPDLSYGLTTRNANVQNGSRRITFSGSIPMLLAEQDMGPFSSQQTSTAYGDTGSAYEGQIFQAGGREYNILKVVSDTEIHLDEQYRGTSSVDNIDWKIKKRYYDLPDDCLELLNLSQRDVPAASGMRPPNGKIPGLTKRRDEELNLREDYTATYAECYVDTPPINVPPAEKFTKVSDIVDAGASIPSNYYIEVCWAFHYWGAKIGPLSEPFLVKTGPSIEGGSNHAITLQFTSFDDKPIRAQTFNLVVDRVPNKWEGLRKVIYFNQNLNPATGVRNGLPCWRSITFGSTTGTEGTTLDAGKPLLISDETSNVTLQYLNQFNAGNPRYLEWDGSIPRIRPYPRITAWDFTNGEVSQGEITPGARQEYFRRLECRYIKKPLRMVLSTDTPQFPFEFHQLVVYGVLEDIYNKSGNMELAASYRKRIEKELPKLERRYIDSIDTYFVRGSFTIGNDGGPFYDQNSIKLKP